MNTLSRTITGILTIILGSVLTIIGFYQYSVLIYGIPIFIIGIFILFNKKEDNIEKIKTK
jgi:membrane-bound ClpP family serine protease|tara:strand:- start:54 stop:233 length:180 start_codon:yes stop_codon:yes gene_type:complete